MSLVHYDLSHFSCIVSFFISQFHIGNFLKLRGLVKINIIVAHTNNGHLSNLFQTFFDNLLILV